MSVTVVLRGGMGNQCFEYATARSVARRTGSDLLLNVDTFERDPMRIYSLGLWRGVNEPIVRTRNGKLLEEKGLPYDQALIESATSECSLYGYWQCEKYFADVREEILEAFVPRAPLAPFSQGIERRIAEEGERSAFLTVRRSDYKYSNFHGVLPLDYYLKAAELVKARVADPCFFVFSDEPEWVTPENFRFPYRWEVAGNYEQTSKRGLGREDAELWLMSKCRHAVLANSTYSWWGAWLHRGSDDGRVVVAPERWFFDAPEDPRDIVPERWIKI